MKDTLHPMAALAIVVFVAGLAAWLWLGDWRYAATGLLAMVVCAAIGSAMDRRKG